MDNLKIDRTWHLYTVKVDLRWDNPKEMILWIKSRAYGEHHLECKAVYAGRWTLEDNPIGKELAFILMSKCDNVQSVLQFLYDNSNLEIQFCF